MITRIAASAAIAFTITTAVLCPPAMLGAAAYSAFCFGGILFAHHGVNGR